MRAWELGNWCVYRGAEQEWELQRGLAAMVKPLCWLLFSWCLAPCSSGHVDLWKAHEKMRSWKAFTYLLSWACNFWKVFYSLSTLLTLVWWRRLLLFLQDSFIEVSLYKIRQKGRVRWLYAVGDGIICWGMHLMVWGSY